MSEKNNILEREKAFNEAQRDPELMSALMQSLEEETIQKRANKLLKKAFNKSLAEKKMISILPNLKTASTKVAKSVNYNDTKKLATFLAKKRKGENYKMVIMRLEAQKKERENPALTGLPRVRLVDVPGDGDCFYRSLIMASHEQGILDLLKTCLNIVTVSKIIPLIEGLRNYIADNIDSRLIKTYQVLKNLYLEDNNTFLELIHTTFAEWHIDVILSSLAKQNQEQFVKQIKEGIRLRGNWASEIEVKFLEEKLSDCGIELNVSNSLIGRAHKIKNGKEIITLYNSSDVHFQYFSFNLEPKIDSTRHNGGKVKAKLRKTRKTRKLYF
jgi:hypothetical protein